MNNNDEERLVFVIPVYEDRQACSRLLDELIEELGSNIFVVLVDDGSVHEPLGNEVLESAGLAGAVVFLRRNVGHQRAIAIGLAYVFSHVLHKNRVVVMDSDGEDLPETVPRLLEALEDHATDIVVAKRQSRVQSLLFKMFYGVYRLLFRSMTGRVIHFGNFMAMKRSALARLVSMQELPVHLAGAVLASKLRIRQVSLPRGPRYAGNSKMNFVSLALHGFKAFMIFAEDVLVRVGIACSLIALLAIAGVILAIVLKTIGFSTPGWFSVALGILVLMLLQTGALALMSLMLTGVMRGGTVASIEDYTMYIDQIVEVYQPD